MDTGTGLTSQIYHIDNQFLPKHWITERWDEEYYITAVAGSVSGYSLVIMSKGTSFTQQSYKLNTFRAISDVFPIKWINKKWKEGFFVTSMATSDFRWAIIVSRNTPYKEQCIEVDCQYPSEGIHKRWNADFRITSCTATSDQTVFVFSLLKRLLRYETQETLRTTTFPYKYIKEMWSQNFYIANIAYGRTIC